MNILVNEMDQSQVDQYYFLTYIGEIIKNVFFIVALFIFNRQKKTSKPQSSVPYLDMI
jgi:hypothetical protein